MYEAVEVSGEIQQLTDSKAFEPKFFLKDTFIVFLENEMLVRECTKKTGWYLGDITGGPRIAENCSIAMIDPSIHKTDSVHAIASGGFVSGYATTPVYSMIFDSVEENTVDRVTCAINGFMPMLK